MGREVTKVNSTMSDDTEYNNKIQQCLTEMFNIVGERLLKEASKEGWKAPNQVAAEKAIAISEIADRLDKLHPWQSHEIATIDTVVNILREVSGEYLHEAIESLFPGTSKPA